MKIGIITFHSAHNYGAVLQAWSLQEYLKQQGHQVQIVNLRLPVIDKLYRLVPKTDKKVCGSEWINRLVNGIYYQMRYLYRKLRPDPGKVEKYKAFEHFINHVLPVTEEYGSYEELCKADLRYDALIAGSDQIWNGAMMKTIDLAYFLQFGNKGAIRISYAASIGTDEILPEYKMLFRRYLRDLDHISVREKKAKEEVEALTDDPVDLVADPTFLLSKDSFESLRKKARKPERYIYVHNVHLNRLDETLNGIVEEMSKRLGLPVVHNWGTKVFSNEAGHFTGGVGEFLDLVASAEYIVTNSFHCTIFAIIYHKDFITVPHFKHPDRMRNLLESLGISEHLIGSREQIPSDLSCLEVDYAAVEEKRSLMGAEAKDFLARALKGKKEPDRRTYLESGDIFHCYGCGACKDACPKQAIAMEPDEEGFLYPVIDERVCDDCGKCQEVCIYNRKDLRNTKESGLPVVYGAYHKDPDVVDRSTNGGVFTALYRKILEKGGHVAGVRYDGDLRVVYDLASDEEGCRRFLGSKPVEADGGSVRLQVRELLERGESVLFTGTSCQIAGLKSLLGKDYPGLYTVEHLCDGVGSPKVYRKYCDHLEQLFSSKLVDIQFNNKFKGADKPFVVTEFESGSTDVEDASKHAYNGVYLQKLIQRPSCYTCGFNGAGSGVADITIGRCRTTADFGSGQGTSLVRVNTDKGKRLFDEVKDSLIWQETSWKKSCASGQKGPLRMEAKRGKLMSRIDEGPIDGVLSRFV